MTIVAGRAVNLNALRIDLIDKLVNAQWTGGPDVAYAALRERSILQVDAILQVIRWHLEGTPCRCSVGTEIPHEAGASCRRSAGRGPA